MRVMENAKKRGRKSCHKVKIVHVHVLKENIMKEIGDELSPVHVLDIVYLVLQKANKKR